MELTKEKQVLYDKYIGNFATPKKLNRSGKIVPQSYIDKIEDAEVTSIMLEELYKTVPIFIYKTCVTIHGTLPKIETTRIGGYKNVIQNKNGSLEIRYSAIDYTAKWQTAQYLTLVDDWHKNENSTTGIYFFKSFRTTDKQLAIDKYHEFKKHAESININGLFAKIFVTGQNYWGMYYIELNVIPLSITTGALEIAIKLTGYDRSYFIEKQYEKEQKQQEREDKARQLQNKRDEAKQQATEQVSRYRPEAVQKQVGAVYITPIVNTANKTAYVFTRVEKIGSFGKVEVSQYRSEEPVLNTELLKYYPKQVKPTEIPNTRRYN